MKIKEILPVLALFIWSNFSFGQTTLFARTNGTWNNGHPSTGTWSTVGSSGPSCNCLPSANDSVVISGYSILLTNDGNVKDLTVQSGGELTFNNNASLIVHNNGILLLRNTGTIDHSGTNSNTALQFMTGSPQLSIENGFSFNLEDIILEDGVNLSISGSGNFSLTKDFSFEGNSSSVQHNGTGLFFIGRDLKFAPGFSNNEFVNNGKLYINDDVDINGTRNRLINNDSIDLQDDFTFKGSFCSLENGTTAVLLCDDDISFDASADCKITNHGELLVRSQGVGGIVHEGLRDSILNHGSMTTLLHLKVQASHYDNNVFINGSTGELNINGEFDLNDADFHFDNSGRLNLLGRFDEMGGNETILNRNGGVINYYGSHNADLNNEMSLFANFNSSHFNYLGNLDQDVIVPQDAYRNLTLGGNGNKEMQGSFVVESDLNILGSATLDASTNNYTLFIRGNWNNASNFNERSGTVVFDGSTNQLLNHTAPEFFHILTVNKPAGQLILNTNISIVNHLSLQSGPVELNSNHCSLLNQTPLALTQSTGYLISEKASNESKFSRVIGTTAGTYSFPFGTNNGVFIPVEIEHVSGDLGLVTLSTYPTGSDNLPWPTSPEIVNNLNSVIGANPDNRDNTIDRFWQIDKSSETGVANITFSYSQSEVTANVVGNEGLLQAQRYESATDQWESAIPSQISDALNNRVSVPNVSNFSPWTLSISTAALPITLMHFSATLIQGEVDLQWTTSAELNNDYFTLEKSSDAETFHSFAFINGAGTSNSEIQYAEIDSAPYQGVSYYRLKQTDFNGKSTYSQMVNIRNIAGNEQMTIYPNPTKSSNINISTENIEGLTEITILDLQGKICHHEQTLIHPGATTHKIFPIQPLSEGIYMLNINTQHGVYSSKLVISH